MAPGLLGFLRSLAPAFISIVRRAIACKGQGEDRRLKRISELVAKVHALKTDGRNIRAIARELEVSPTTVLKLTKLSLT